MSTNLQTLSYLCANLAAGRNPELERAPLASATPPDVGGGGYTVTGALTAYLRVALRECPFYRTCYYVVTTADLTAEYDVEIDGVTVTYDAATETPADLAELLAGIAAAINADGSLSDFTATVANYAGGSANDSVRIVRAAATDALDDYAFDGSADGTAVVALYADAVSGTLRVYDRPDVAPSSGFVATGSALYRRAVGWLARPFEGGNLSRSLDGRGYARNNLDVAGCAAVWPAVDVSGHPDDGGSVTVLASVLVYPKRQESVS